MDSFFLPFPPRRASKAHLCLWGRAGGAGAHGRRDAEKQPNPPRSTAGHPLEGFPGTGFMFLLPSLLPLFLLSPSFRLRRCPPLASSEERGATRLASKGWLCSERKVLPASAGASLLLSPGTSLTLGCAKRPLVVRFPADASCAPGEAPLPTPRLGARSLRHSLRPRRAWASPVWRILNLELRPEQSETQLVRLDKFKGAVTLNELLSNVLVYRYFELRILKQGSSTHVIPSIPPLWHVGLCGLSGSPWF